MATKSEIERLTVVETELKMVKVQNDKDHAEIKRDVCEIKDMVKEALEGKADRTEVESLKKWLWVMLSGLLGFLIWVLQEYLRSK